MANLFTFILLLHLLGALLLVAAMGLQTMLALLMRRATRPGELRHLLAASRWAPRLFAPATALLLASGVALALWLGLSGARWGWMVVAFVSVIALASWSKAAGRRRHQTLARLVAESGDVLSLELASALGDASAVVHVALDVWAITGLVVLMVYQPTAWVAVLVMVVALLGTAAVRTLARKRFAQRPEGRARVSEP